MLVADVTSPALGNTEWETSAVRRPGSEKIEIPQLLDVCRFLLRRVIGQDVNALHQLIVLIPVESAIAGVALSHQLR